MFANLAATAAGQTQPATGVLDLDGCRARCLADTNCAGFNWMYDARNASLKCLIYNLAVGDVAVVALFDLYVRARCQPSMFITFAPGENFLPERFVVTSAREYCDRSCLLVSSFVSSLTEIRFSCHLARMFSV